MIPNRSNQPQSRAEQKCSAVRCPAARPGSGAERIRRLPTTGHFRRGSRPTPTAADGLERHGAAGVKRPSTARHGPGVKWPSTARHGRGMDGTVLA